MDVIDVAQRRQLEEIEQALAARPIAQQGRSHCKHKDCGEPISPQRQDLGAQLCIDCQRAAEHKAHTCARVAV